MSGGPVSPLLLDRYELKYLIPMSLVDPISKFAEQFCDMDYFSKISHDGFYTINSLYFETPNMHFIRAKEAGTKKFSLRVRSYGDEPKAPYYFETKEKVGAFSKKRRGKVPIENWPDLFFDPASITSFDPKKDAHLQHFLYLTQMYNAAPIILTQYRRRAYISKLDDYARITFDRSLKYRPETGYTVNPDYGMTSYDHPEAFYHTGNNVVLELKCEQKIPVWIVELIKKFELVRCGFSKFENSMFECFRPHYNEQLTTDRVIAY